MADNTLVGGAVIFILALLFFIGALIYAWQRYSETKPPSAWDRMLATVSNSFHQELDELFNKLGQAISQKRSIVISVVFLVVIILGLGFNLAFMETRIFKLWVQEGTRVVGENSYAEKTWGDSRSEIWIMSQKDRVSNILTQDAFKELYETTAGALNVTTNVENYRIPGIKTITWDEVCDEAEVPAEAFRTVISGVVWGLIFNQLVADEVSKFNATNYQNYEVVVRADLNATNPTWNSSMIDAATWANLTHPLTAYQLQAVLLASQTPQIQGTAYGRLYNPVDPITSNYNFFYSAQLGVAHLTVGVDINQFWRFSCFRKSAIDCFKEGGFDYKYPLPESTPAGTLNLNSLLQIFGLPDYFSAKPSIYSSSDEQILSTLQQGCRQFANVLLPSGVLFGGISQDENGNWKGASAIRSVLDVGSPQLIKAKFEKRNRLNSPTSTWKMSESMALDIVLKWETDLIEYFNQKKAASQYLIGFFMSRSGDDIVAQAAETNIGLLIAGYFFEFIYALFTMLRVPDWVGTRGLLSIAGVGMILLGIVAALGFSSYCGVDFNPISTQILPYLALAIGCDEVFVMLSASPELRHHKSLTTAELTGRMLGEAGPAITLTAIANALAFFMGSLTPIPAVSSFTTQAALVIIANYFMLILAFTAFISYDYDRQKEDMNCCIPCMKSESKEDGTDFMRGLNRFAADVLAPLLTNPFVKAIVFIVFSIIFGVAVKGIAEMKLGLDLSDIAPKTSYAWDFLDLTERYFDLWPGTLVVRNMDHSAAEVQKAIVQVQDGLQTSGWLNNDLTVQDLSWFSGMIPKVCFAHGVIMIGLPLSESATMEDTGKVMKTTELPVGCQQLIQALGIPNGPILAALLLQASYVLGPETIWPGYLEAIPNSAAATGYTYVVHIPRNYTLPAAHFAKYSAAYLNTLGVSSLNNVYFEDDKVMASKVSLVLVGLKRNADFRLMMEETRAITDAVQPVDIYPMGIPYTYWEQYLHIREIFAQNLSLALFAVFLVTLFFLMNPLLAIELTVVMILTLMEIYGFMHFANMKLNAVPVVNLIMATGVTVNFTVHMGHAFLVSTGTRDERMTKTLKAMFAPIIHGGAATILGMLMIAFSPNKYFYVYFFEMYLIMVILGVANEILLLSVILSLIGPRSTFESEDQKDKEMSEI